MSEKDILQIITPTTSTIYIPNTLTHAEENLRKLSVAIRLDFHGVADLLPGDLHVSHQPACIISYVGSKSPYRQEVKEEIEKRMASGQIKFGVMVFVRGSGKTRNCFTNPGSKAWVNSLLQIPQDVKGIFIDDMEDHILSTQLLCPYIQSVQFNGNKEELLDLFSTFI